MLKLVALPVVMALSSVAAQPQPSAAPVPARQKTAQPAQQTETITCPLTGTQLPSCCCPLKK